MLKTDKGVSIAHERVIFPFISLQKRTGTFYCLGTGFFIHHSGWFVTAKHVLLSGDQLIHERIMAVQTLSDGSFATREITHLSAHPTADIVIGQLSSQGRDEMAVPVAVEDVPTLGLSFRKLNERDPIIAFGYPKTSKTVNGAKQSFHLKGTWSEGVIEEYFEHGCGFITNPCFRTTLLTESGASGGPVFYNNHVIGINSTGYDLGEGEVPISFFTPIHCLLSLRIEISTSTSLSISELIKRGDIRGQF